MKTYKEKKMQQCHHANITRERYSYLDLWPSLALFSNGVVAISFPDGVATFWSATLDIFNSSCLELRTDHAQDERCACIAEWCVHTRVCGFVVPVLAEERHDTPHLQPRRMPSTVEAGTTHPAGVYCQDPRANGGYCTAPPTTKSERTAGLRSSTKGRNATASTQVRWDVATAAADETMITACGKQADWWAGYRGMH
jgi:hypothetical protein